MLGSLALVLFTVDVAQAQLFRGRERRMERRDVRWGGPNDGVVYNSTNQANPSPMAPAVMTGTTARISYYYTPTQGSQAVADGAQIRVILPDAQCKVYFNDKATTSTGTDRLFLTPQLTPGAQNSYVIRVSYMMNGQEMTREQTLATAPNMTYVVDFTRVAPTRQ
jgi:uncharacterized protein (TIGR03000 family)